MRQFYGWQLSDGGLRLDYGLANTLTGKLSGVGTVQHNRPGWLQTGRLRFMRHNAPTTRAFAASIQALSTL